MTNLAYIHTEHDTPSADVILSVEFESRDGRRFRAIGGGATWSDAIAFARATTPAGHWRPVKIDDLYGD
jgi:hypothetical protein